MDKHESFILYGIEGPESGYRIARYEIFYNEATVRDFKYEASRMRDYNPGIKKIYLMSNRRGLRYECHKAMHGTERDRVEFKITLEQEGIEVN